MHMIEATVSSRNQARFYKLNQVVCVWIHPHSLYNKSNKPSYSTNFPHLDSTSHWGQ